MHPDPAPIAVTGLEADPYFTADGRTLYFISTRATNQSKSSALDIWRMDRNAKGRWATPQRLPEPVNSSGAEWFPRPGPHGWLYFGSNRPGGFGGTDIWRARKTKGGIWQLENTGPAINGPGEDYEFSPAPDGRSAVLASDSGIYMIHRTEGHWQPRVRMNGTINLNGTEIGPLWAVDNSGFWFSRDVDQARSGEILFVSLRTGGGPDQQLDKCNAAGARGRK
jgi:hypothetical protein